ncbi:MAG: hypothetical protein AB8B87_00835 [Granulosicoccus sp.]
MRTGFKILKRVRPNALSILCLVMACFSQAGASDNTSLEHLVTPCLACHSLFPDSTTHVGPTLAGVAGRALGTVANYTYSDAFSAKASSGLVWDRELMGQFLENPQAVVEGTAMRYADTPDAEHRTQLLDWLFSNSPEAVADLSNATYTDIPAVKQVLDIEADRDYGEYLAGECMTCHQPDDHSGRVPPIHKLTPDYFVNALLEYQNGVRSNQVMRSVAGALGAEELAALSAVFAQRVTH